MLPGLSHGDTDLTDLGRVIHHSSREQKAPVLSAGRDTAAEIFGKDAARRLVEENPRAVIDGEPLEIDGCLPFEPATKPAIISPLFQK